MTTYVIDTYAWVEYLVGSALGKNARQFIEGGDSSTPSIVLAELVRWYLREIEAGRRNPREMSDHLDFVSTSTRIVPLDDALAREAGELDFLMKKRVRGWPLADSVIYAGAKARRGKVVTGDPHFAGLEGVEFLDDSTRRRRAPIS